MHVCGWGGGAAKATATPRRAHPRDAGTQTGRRGIGTAFAVTRAGSFVIMSPPMSTECRVCASPVAPTITAREMMLGTREEFRYGLCAACGAMQLLDVPPDPRRYCPGDYYAFAPRRRT